MAFIKRAVLRADSGPAPEGETGASQPPQQQQQSSESLSVVSTDVSEKRRTLLFGPSVVSQSTIDFYVLKGYFAEGVCHPPGAEVIPVPETGEVVVLRIFLLRGLDFRWIH